MINEKKAHRFCKDDISKIENYDKAIADATQTWHCHHRLELTLDREFAHTAEDLIRMDMYYRRPYFELIFLTKSEHHSLHNRGKNNPSYGKTAWNKGKAAWNTGKALSDETRKKMSESAKARWARKVYDKIRNKIETITKS